MALLKSSPNDIEKFTQLLQVKNKFKLSTSNILILDIIIDFYLLKLHI